MNENEIIERFLKMDWLEFLGCVNADSEGAFDIYRFNQIPLGTPEYLTVQTIKSLPVKSESTRLYEMRTVTTDRSLNIDFACREVKPWLTSILYAVGDVLSSLEDDYILTFEYEPTVSPKYKRSKCLTAIGLISGDKYFRFGGPKLSQRRLLIHQGNFPRDSKGCLLIGTATEHSDEIHSGSQVIIGSTGKMNELWSRVGQHGAVRLQISGRVLKSILEQLDKE